MNRDTTCLICGDTGPGVRVFLVEWRQPVGGRLYDAVPRCDDEVACRARLEAQAEVWPVASHGVEEVPA